MKCVCLKKNFNLGGKMNKKHFLIIVLLLSLTALFAQITYNEVETNDIATDADTNGLIIETKNAYLKGEIGGGDQFDFWKLSSELEGNIKISMNEVAGATFALIRHPKIVFQNATTPQTVNIERGELYYVRVRGKNAIAAAYTVTLYDEATLPVELSAFDAVLLNTNNVQLNWTTQTEANMIGYNIYRANDENQANSIRVNNETIVATNTSSEHNYSFTDYGIEEGEYYYWLQSVEANNETEMHGPVYLVYTLDNNVPNPEYQYQHNLIGAYPNPFNPSTSIQYELAGAADVQIAIYNAKGQKVKTFIDSHSKKGTYSVHWNGKDENGKFVNSGVYFYTMTAGKTTQSKKMLLVK